MNTAENVEESVLNELMGALGLTEQDVQSVARSATPEVQKVAIAEVRANMSEPKARIRRHHYTNQADRLRDNLGEKFDAALLLTNADAQLKGAARSARANKVATDIKALGKKVQNRVAFLVEYASGRTTTLNGVMRTGLDVLQRDGKLTTGKNSNLTKALLDSGKTPATSRAMSGNTILAMAALQIVKKAGDGVYIPHPDSAMLERLTK